MDQLAFITARLEGLEERALAVQDDFAETGLDWHAGNGESEWAGDDLDVLYIRPPLPDATEEVDKHWSGIRVHSPAIAGYIAAMDPQRTLNLIKGLRTLLALGPASDVLAAVASIWADHPDYKTA